jgi:hypothetical protein
MATINHERKRVVINVIHFREDSKLRPHAFNIGKLDETLGQKKLLGLTAEKKLAGAYAEVPSLSPLAWSKTADFAMVLFRR